MYAIVKRSSNSPYRNVTFEAFGRFARKRIGRGDQVKLLQFSRFEAYRANEKSNTHNFFGGTRWILLLMKISESFEIRVNILKILISKLKKL